MTRSSRSPNPKPMIDAHSGLNQTESRTRKFTASQIARSVVIFSVVGVILYGAAALASDYSTVGSALAAFPGKMLTLILALVVVGWLIRAWRFHFYLQQAGRFVPLGYSVAVFLASFALTGTPGKLGEAVKGVFLKEDFSVPMTTVVGILFVERLMDLLGVLFLGSFSLLLFTGWRAAFLLCAGIVLGAGIFLCLEGLYRPVLEKLGRIGFLSWVCEKVLGILLAGRELMTPRTFFVGLVASVAAWGLESISMYFVLSGLNLPSTVLDANFVYCFSTIVGAISMLPGGIGGTEAGMVGLLAVMGISYSSGLPAVILIRLCTLWFAILVGIVFVIIMLARARKRQKAITES